MLPKKEKQENLEALIEGKTLYVTNQVRDKSYKYLFVEPNGGVVPRWFKASCDGVRKI